eukprot:CAMPEP_0196572774 /NCGR_PEP_ID=MMETSP1081-20130531/2763_1 /TAXON_ID=36882 /ORGANISM="Pyramimonas amylifera, Strain CCMP720" /LENGTH=160 /DNA_ID=CAMNT_0041890205 /DNA_START=418 /DNA_END=900 /DNA_ORIENTATION=+
MYAVDMVGFRGRISLAIADLCPTTQNLTLPPSIRDKLKDLTASLPESLPRRQAPDWGVPIFSAECCLVGPETEEDIGAFLRFATRALEILRQEAEVAKKANPKEETENGEAQTRFCHFQCKNEKTKRILASSMGQEWADRYMTEIMFDLPNGFDKYIENN